MALRVRVMMERLGVKDADVIQQEIERFDAGHSDCGGAPDVGRALRKMKGIRNMDELRLWYALYQLEIKYWYDVDCNGGSSVHELYCDDGLLSVGGKEFKGRHTIKTFYEWRRGRVETARHVISNLTVRGQDERRATSFGLITIYRARGIRAPLNTGNVPALVSDFTSECILCPNDVWRYASHVLRPVFIGSDTPFSLSIDPEFVAYLAGSRDSGDRASADHVWATPQASKEGDLNHVE